MKIALISFGTDGWQLAENLEKKLLEEGHEAEAWVKSRYMEKSMKDSLTVWTCSQFARSDAIIFVGACGIAVRAIAPFIQSKKTDPAVVVVDEKGKYAIALLSGHLGGANELAESVGRMIGALPVITTATDGRGLWAVDMFAKKNNCEIKDIKKIKIISSRILAGEKVGFFSVFPYQGKIPQGVTVYGEESEKQEYGVVISPFLSHDEIFQNTLRLIPKCIWLGIGCKKGVSKERIEDAVDRTLTQTGIDAEAVCGVATIDLKEKEEGLLAYCREKNFPFQIYPAQSLAGLAGDFNGSEFVTKITGVDNVCERSAFFAASRIKREGEVKLIVPKCGRDGVTVAAAMKKWSMKFE